MPEPESSLALIVASSIFLATYIGILTEHINRTISVLVGAVVMIVVGTWMGFYDKDIAVKSIDFDTICLLAGMMIIVAIIQRTGLFAYIAIRGAQVTKGSPWRMIVVLGLVTTLVSMVLDNVTTLIVIAPVTVSIAEVVGMNPIPLLVSEALLSNTGGVATLIGDPPNILIGSAANLSFSDFLIHLGPAVLLAWFISQVMLLVLFRKELARSPDQEKGGLEQLNARRAVTDRDTAGKMLVVLGITVVLFFVHQWLKLSPGMVALVGASIGLLWIQPKITEVLSEVHWDVLIFFVGLFVIVGGLEATGVLDIVADQISKLTDQGMIVGALAVLWVSAIMSALVDNIPFTIIMLPVIAGLAARGISIGPLWWALALGVGFGGNATPIGSTANVLTVSISERANAPISTWKWMRSGLPIAFAACILASGVLVVAIKLGLW